MNAKSKRKTLPLGPTGIDQHAWFYIEKNGLLIVQQVYSSHKQYLGTGQTKLPWGKLVRALNTYREVVKAKRKKPKP